MQFVKVPIDCDNKFCGRCRFLQMVQEYDGSFNKVVSWNCKLFLINNEYVTSLTTSEHKALRSQECLSANLESTEDKEC